MWKREYLGTFNQEKAHCNCETSRRFVSSSRKSKSNNEGQCLTDCREVFPYTALSARRAHRLLIILVQAFYARLQKQGIRKHLHNCVKALWLLGSGLMLINNGFVEPTAEPIQPGKINPHIELIPHCLWSNECRPTDKFSSTWPDLETWQS